MEDGAALAALRRHRIRACDQRTSVRTAIDRRDEFLEFRVKFFLSPPSVIPPRCQCRLS
jgi:hypothetical protein